MLKPKEFYKKGAYGKNRVTTALTIRKDLQAKAKAENLNLSLILEDALKEVLGGS